MGTIKISDKIKLENGYEYCLIEKNFLGDIEIINKPNFTIGINKEKYRKTVSLAIILLTIEDDYVGHITANLYNNGIASLTASGIMGIDLPDKFKKYYDIIQEHKTALLVADEYGVR